MVAGEIVMRRIFSLLVAAFMISAAPANSQLRSLDVPNDKGWQHARTGIILMSKLGNFQRSDLKDNGTSESDVSATYFSADKKDTASIYIYRQGIVSLPIWFDRSLYAMTTNPKISIGSPLGPITRFIPPNSRTESGLRIVFNLRGSDRGATGLAMVPFGEWLVAVRLTSPTMTSVQLDANLLEVLSKVRWPEKRPLDEVAVPIAPCPNSLKTKRAKVVPPDLAQALIGATLSSIVTTKTGQDSEKENRTVIYCREGMQTLDYGAYRGNADTKGYVLAIGDAGVGASVYPGFSLNGEKGQYSVTLARHDSLNSYPSFNALPEPKQVFALVMSRGPMSSTTRGGNSIILGPDGK